MSIGVYFGLTDGIINGSSFFWGESSQVGIMDLRAEKKSLNKALTDAEDLQAKAEVLKRQANSLSPENLVKLDTFLPDSINDLQLVVDINGIAKRSNMSISDVKLVTEDRSATGRVTPSAGVATKSFAEVATVPLAFTVQGTYPNLKSFLTDLSNNLRLIDVTKLDFGQNSSEDLAKGIYKYNITVETYWLK